jgi:hypothetical protein
MMEDSDSKAEQSKIDDTTVYITSFDATSDEFAALATKELANKACVHQLTTDVSKQQSITETMTIDANNVVTTSRYDSRQFYGVMIDIGASKRSTAGYS